MHRIVNKQIKDAIKYAVEENGLAFQYDSNRIQEEYAVLAAVKQDGDALNYEERGWCIETRLSQAERC